MTQIRSSLPALRHPAPSAATKKCSCDRIGLEVTLPAAARVDTDVVIALAPGPGDNPAIAGVDYVDEPIRVTIPAGRSSAVVTVRLPLNSGLDEARSLSATASLAS